MNHTEEASAVPDLSILVQADKLQLLYRQSSPAVLISILNAVILVTLLWSVQDHQVLLNWFGFLIVASAVRLLLFYRYHKVAPVGEQVLSWEKPYFITLIVSSLAWGFGSLLIMPADSPVHQALIFYTLIGMSGGAISVYSAHRAMTLTTIASVLLPATGYFFISGNYIFVGMSVGASLFFLSAIRSTGVLSFALQQNFLMTHQLESAKAEAERFARTDVLTGLYNRRAFYEYGKVLANNSLRNKDEIAMIHMDIDNFKLINDKYGHAAGDAALVSIGKILIQRLRKSDVFARIGGEEFGMLLPLTRMPVAAKLAEELRVAIERTPIPFEGKTFSITASFGVTSGMGDIDTLVRQADLAMYESKNSGRNTVVIDS